MNGRWQMWLPDSIADWDAITGDYAARRGWEFHRFESLKSTLRPDDILYEVGAEHGWISAVISREMCPNMVLFEPSPEMWTNIRKTWRYNGLEAPMGCWPGFVSDVSTPQVAVAEGWPECALERGPDVGAMPYRSLQHHAEAIPSITLDHYASLSGITPTAINIDIEGAELRALQGARALLTHPASRLRVVWVSVHPDLMAGYNHTPDMLMDYMANLGWWGWHLDTDHEEHWVFTRTPLPEGVPA